MHAIMYMAFETMCHNVGKDSGIDNVILISQEHDITRHNLPEQWA